jgi:hypothetical protein
MNASTPAVVVAFLLACLACTSDVLAAKPGEYDVTPRPVSLIEPGTVIDAKAPKAWSHLIIRSHPRIADEDRGKVNSLTADLASFLFTSVLAKVEPYRLGEDTRYRFADVGVGFGMPIQGRNTILSPDTQRELGANLSFLGQQVLAACYEEQKAGLIVCHGETMAIVDTRVVLNREGKHRWCVFRYALLIDPRNGSLAVLLWPIDLDDSGRRYLEPAGLVEWLAPNKLEDCTMRVDPKQFRLGIPSKTAFAVAHMPRGDRRLDFPSPEVAQLLSLQQMSPEAAYKAEAWLWKMIQLELEKN